VRSRGAIKILGTAGNPTKLARARELGANAVLNHGDPDWPQRLRDSLGEATIDVLFESIGGSSAHQLLDLLTPGTGRILLYGRLSGEPAAITASDLLSRGLTLTGCAGPAWVKRVEAARPQILESLAHGALRPTIDGPHALADAAAAHKRIEARQAVGKVVLTP
jgi:NADPH:quinone reductase-like Zn-dependent oxidoreductase